MDKLKSENFQRNKTCLDSLKSSFHDYAVYYSLGTESNGIRGPSGFSREKGYFQFLSSKKMQLQVCETTSGGAKPRFDSTLYYVPGVTPQEDIAFVKSCLERVLGADDAVN